MPIRVLLILMRLLDHYQARMSNPEKAAALTPEWKYYFDRSELMYILDLKLGADVEKLSLAGATSEHLLEHIADEKYIVQYVLQEVEPMVNPNTPTLMNQDLLLKLLEQTGQQDHDLGQKDLSEMDDDDKLNLHTILRKAGWFRKVYGVFKQPVENVMTTKNPPLVYYDTEAEAFLELARMFHEDGIELKDYLVQMKEVVIPIM